MKNLKKCQCGKTRNPNGNCDGSHSKNKFKNLSFIILSIIFSLAFGNNNENKKVDAQKSKIEWKADKVTGSHNGTINIKNGHLIFNKDVLAGGEFEIDMNSIECVDLEGEWKNKLEGHLKSDDFFSVENFQISKLKITKVKQLTSNKYECIALLTIKDQSKKIKFEAIVLKDSARANILIDRTQFNIKYGSGSFFKGLGDNMIYDEFSLNINLIF